MEGSEQFDVWMLVYVVALFATIAASFALAIRRSGRQLPEEHGRAPHLWQRCGGRVGRVRYTWPFVRIAVYEDLIVVAALKGAAIGRGEIERVDFGRVRGSGTLGQSVNIFHRSSVLPSPISLYSTEGAALAKVIASATG